MKKYERLTKWEYPNCASVNGGSPIDKDMANAINRLAELEDKIENGTLIELSVVAELIREFVGDDCPCNFNDIDEWLPYVCEFADTTCPDGKCWEQYLKTKLKELRGEEE